MADANHEITALQMTFEMLTMNGNNSPELSFSLIVTDIQHAESESDDDNSIFNEAESILLDDNEEDSTGQCDAENGAYDILKWTISQTNDMKNGGGPCLHR